MSILSRPHSQIRRALRNPATSPYNIRFSNDSDQTGLHKRYIMNVTTAQKSFFLLYHQICMSGSQWINMVEMLSRGIGQTLSFNLGTFLKIPHWSPHVSSLYHFMCDFPKCLHKNIWPYISRCLRPIAIIQTIHKLRTTSKKFKPHQPYCIHTLYNLSFIYQTKT